MGTPNQQIGWSQEAKLLQQISKQLDRLIQVAGTAGTTTTTTTAP
jgi:UDP-N-acetylmuramate-alanine ligase